MTELKLTKGGSVYSILVRDGDSLADAANTLERWARDWERSKRKAAA